MTQYYDTTSDDDAKARRRRRSADAAMAYREAGHALAACQGELAIGPVTIEPEGDGDGAVHWTHRLIERARHDLDRSDAARLRAERHILICLAGPAAQRRYSRRSWRAFHGDDDLRVATWLADHFHGSDAAVEPYLAYLRRRADELIELYWRPVEAVVAALLERRTLSGAEVEALIRGAGGDGR